MIAATRTQLDKTGLRLALVSRWMANLEKEIGRPGFDRWLFLELNLAIFLAEYDQAIAELVEQRSNLHNLAEAMGWNL